ncbi:MAG: cyclohex-1-ene-1-carboxylate:CoA ligase [Gammaproteobacteria bacterium BRH_c0]|nr:MAG: cyclohex-1-ene-1-carboxylate:CoA ligase [Gammaproteobacteria bacterium BRH_c0]
MSSTIQASTLHATTLWKLLEARAAQTPNLTMLIEAATDRHLTFADCLHRAERMAAGLYQRGVRADDVIAWQLPTRVDTVLLALALARLGVVQNPILHLYRERELGELVRQSQPSLLIIPGPDAACDYPTMAASACPDVPQLVLSGDLPDGDASLLPPPLPSAAGSVRWLYCTSGTTAGPKAARHTDSSVMAGGYTLGQSMGVELGDMGSIAYPFAHIGGVMYLTMMLAAGMSAVLLEKFIPTVAVEAYRRYGVTHAGGSTAHYQAFLAEQRKNPGEKVIPTLKVLSGGGAAKPPELVYQVQQELQCKVLHAYGMTEAPLVAHCTWSDSDEELAHTDGCPVAGMEVRIMAEDGKPAPAGETGEIWIRGRSLCQGYLSAEQTAAAFTDDGFYRTGDLGVQRPTGHISITGRIKDIIIRKGENISAREIEDLLFTHLKVANVAVIGLPDAASGERVCAVVEIREGQSALTFSEMVEFLNSQGLMRQKIPEQLEVVEALPRNQALNKVLKYKLREMFSQNT